MTKTKNKFQAEIDQLIISNIISQFGLTSAKAIFHDIFRYKTNFETFEQVKMQLAKVWRGTDKNNFITFKYDPN